MISLTEHNQDLVELDVGTCDLSYAAQNGVNGPMPWGNMLRAGNLPSRYAGSNRWWGGGGGGGGNSAR